MLRISTYATDGAGRPLPDPRRDRLAERAPLRRRAAARRREPDPRRPGSRRASGSLHEERRALRPDCAQGARRAGQRLAQHGRARLRWRVSSACRAAALEAALRKSMKKGLEGAIAAARVGFSQIEATAGFPLAGSGKSAMRGGSSPATKPPATARCAAACASSRPIRSRPPPSCSNGSRRRWPRSAARWCRPKTSSPRSTWRSAPPTAACRRSPRLPGPGFR